MISPPRTVRSRWSTATAPDALATVSPEITRRSSPIRGACLVTFSSTERPTIMAANSASVLVGSARPTTSPRRMTVMSSATSSTSRSLWVMKTIARPSSRSARITSINSPISCGVSTAVGSSKIR